MYHPQEQSRDEGSSKEGKKKGNDCGKDGGIKARRKQMENGKRGGQRRRNQKKGRCIRGSKGWSFVEVVQGKEASSTRKKEKEGRNGEKKR